MIVKNCNTILIHYFYVYVCVVAPSVFRVLLYCFFSQTFLLTTPHLVFYFPLSVSWCCPQNPDIVLVHYLNVPAIEDCGKPCGPILCSINTDKKEWAKWTKEELIGQLKPMCECPITSNHWMHNLSLLKHVLSDHCKQCLKKYHYQTVWGWYNLT